MKKLLISLLCLGIALNAAAQDIDSFPVTEQPAHRDHGPQNVIRHSVKKHHHRHHHKPVHRHRIHHNGSVYHAEPRVTH